jgi:broad specificity phosphatase PhoE
MEVYFIRHGHAMHNQGFEDIGEAAYLSPEYMYSTLTDKGHLQTTSITLPDVNIVLCSPLIRCIQSARNIIGNDKMLYLHDGLLETQGDHLCNIREDKRVIREKYSNVDVTCLKDTYVFQSETDEMLKLRAEETLTSILHGAWLQNFTRLAIVTHHDWLKALLGKSLRNAEVYRVYYSAEEIVKRID